jgi:hypothetical protein
VVHLALLHFPQPALHELDRIFVERNTQGGPHPFLLDDPVRVGTEVGCRPETFVTGKALDAGHNASFGECFYDSPEFRPGERHSTFLRALMATVGEIEANDR